MLQNLTNFFNLITNRKIKKTLDNKDLLAIGTPDARFDGGYQPTAISYEDLEAQIAASVIPATPTLQDVVNANSGISNFGGLGQASITSVNFTTNRALYLNNDTYPSILIVDNLNAANNLQIDVDTLTLDGVPYNWSSIVNQLPSWLEYNATDRTIWNNGKNDNFTNLSFGENALKSNSSFGNTNIAIGYDALTSNTNGSNNLAIGYQALRNNTIGNVNLAIGFESLINNIGGGGNIAIGSQSLKINTSGNNNVAIGNGALLSNTTGGNNTAIGANAGGDNTIGEFNTFVGGTAGKRNTTGNYNTAMGGSALNFNTISNYNTAIGHAALIAASGESNTAVGSLAGQFVSSGERNILLGKSAGLNATTGIRNIYIGVDAGGNITSGSYNIFIGDATSSSATNSFGSIVIGNGATATGNNQFVVGSGGINAGSVTPETNTSTNVWNVIINGVPRKILLA
jgi:hypothetical protein